ncbi:DHA1 family tetracycline resistance protein-like MFS transporter [Deinobacterium chartae]|uniref:DHA1 family tetracycline resistance protein-like MFS transporter n=1 Tax=Deinobacterium chartae TaxID=521158 RepID=A0A841HYD5_9DEIO|nr:TCR/Tet family MFS transporter [Deinobacterium chartae]MBB6096948.1 DHA1 family tetracycline resistance protein-like MFS transporter [Deinobacterium chartae]
MRKRQAGMAFILVTLLIDMLGIGLVIPILPELVTELLGGNRSLASGYYGAFIAVYAAMQFVFAPILGALSDQYGRRPVLLLSLLGAGLDYLLLALAPSLAILFVGRVIAGITGANITVANAYIADVSTPEDRARNFGLLGAVFGVGFIIGPALGGVLGNIDLRLPFYFAAALALINALYGYFVLPESHRPENRRPFGWARANPVGSLGAITRYPVVLGLTITIVLVGLAQNALQSTWVLFTGYRFGWDALQNGFSLMLVGVMAVVVQGGLVGLLIPRLGERRAIVLGLIISAAAFVMYGLATQGWMMYAVLLLGGLGGIAGPAAQGLIAGEVSAQEQGAVQGAIASLSSLTGVFGPLAATALFAYFTGDRAPLEVPGIAFFFGAVLTVLATVTAAVSFRRAQRSGLAQS